MLLHIARAFFLFALASLSLAGERVVLQLKWEHQFQFAGYYAAKWQGYYADAGLDVEIVSAFDGNGKIRNVQQELIDGRADFAIGGSDILLGRDQGHPLVVLAPMFQRSPGALITLGDRKLQSLRDISGLRVAVNPNDFINKELQSLIASRVSRAPAPILIAEPLKLETLLSGKADVLLTYGLSANFAANEAGVEVHTLNISDIEPAFFGDTLYTHERVMKRSPEMVRKFVEASIQGWHYAMKNPEVMATRISEIPRSVSHYESAQDYNRYFAKHVASLLYYPHIPLGFNDPTRWESVHRMLRSAGLVKSEALDAGFHYQADVQAQPKQSSSPWYLMAAGAAGLLLLLLVARLSPVFGMPLLIFGVVMGLALIIEAQQRGRFNEQQRHDVMSQLASIRVQLEGRINGQFALLRGVVGLIASEPDLSQQRYADFVSGLIDQDPLLVNIAAAPDLVVRHVYPLAGNRKAIGLDYRTNAEQMPMVELARDLRRMVVAGPLELVQGGRAIIGRAPVFLDKAGEDIFWGIVSAPVDFDGLVDDIGLNAPNLGLDVAMRHTRLAWAVGDPLIHGDIGVFERDPVSMRVSLGVVEWDIAATPKGGWQSAPAWMVWFWPAAIAIGLVLGLAVHIAFRQFGARIRLSGDLKRNESMLRRVSTIADVGGWQLDLRSGCEHVADEVFALHRMPPRTAGQSPTSWLDFYDETNRNLIKERIREAVSKGKSQTFEVVVEKEGEDAVWLRHIIEPVKEQERVIYLHGVVQDISAIRRADETIRRQATTDPLTGLPNRIQFSERLAAVLSTPRIEEQHVAILFIDLDHFKDVNDSLGHGVGDELLVALGRRFNNLLRSRDMVARLGGDEFTVMLPGVASARACSRVAEQLIALAKEPVTIGDHQVCTSASIGVSLYPQDGRDVETLLRHADQAMYAAKAAGRNTVRYFTSSMQEDVDRRHGLHVKLAAALKEKELSVFYQPIIDAASGQVVKCEALVRWGDVSPAEFIPLAEDTGMIVELGEFVMRQSCEDMAIINAETGTDIALAFNRSTREFLDESRTQHSVLDVLHDQSIFPNITVEITENLLMQDSSEIIDQLVELRRAGIKIAIDDFGTGYSSLSYLQKFPVDVVKIDKSFIRDIENSGDARSLVQAIISMAHSLRILVVAEGVETPGQFSILRQLGCHYLQGFYYSRALCREEFIDFVIQHNRNYPRMIDKSSSASRNHRLAGS
ncbi:diguanylate cyclase (GGDEF)-like protein [Litorivivens lipolytica]|uniref:Diguanylate cyclase (GGDEF)-like protein n=1 Tax=Litorivivens lipolytica TaxID=1524264 RepID=A0A7W4Z7Z6_9GAMM|nr:EAL domain-containing protein [Litorivivens lipolytica]MBB3048515.1 diguanylate cyclase (GGDEF)-like protein [Litorivivens lipolytica]